MKSIQPCVQLKLLISSANFEYITVGYSKIHSEQHMYFRICPIIVATGNTKMKVKRKQSLLCKL